MDLGTLTQQYIDGAWRQGSSDKTLTVRDPFNGEEIGAFRIATVDDLDVAFRSA